MNYHQRLESMQKSNDLKSDILGVLEAYENIVTETGQFKCNHGNCTAGVDTKKRFYITKKGSAYLGHCFNCGKSGWVFNKAEKSTLGLDEIQGLNKANSQENRSDGFVADKLSKMSTSYLKAPVSVRTWLSLYGFDEIDFNTLLARTPSEYEGLVLPVPDAVGVPVGYVSRGFSDWISARYANIFEEKVGKVPWIKLGKSETIVVTEDILSAYKVWKTTGLTTIALLGTSINDKTNAFIAEFISAPPIDIIIWLDKDFAGMSNAANIGSALCTMFGTFGFDVIDDEEEPKKQSEEDIRRILGV